ncbi:HPr family phosphocarrier protein [Ktedonosporobacter rubrisoli]|uniref:Phosphocarrier protein HPr n=1 Tax=Ktedonosporobacter rubrisoli TaxID=2509675 RepID=A0A4V0Z0M5_KTERU|nr:HPr family phosphocarrier protein [Ktedonosporobacter rubrisoli]
MVHNKVGLHARPAAVFVKTAASFSSEISVENLSKGNGPVNAKSILRLLAAAVQTNDRIKITATGDDEKTAVDTLCQLVNTNFGEQD